MCKLGNEYNMQAYLGKCPTYLPQVWKFRFMILVNLARLESRLCKCLSINCHCFALVCYCYILYVGTYVCTYIIKVGGVTGNVVAIRPTVACNANELMRGIYISNK